MKECFDACSDDDIPYIKDSFNYFAQKTFGELKKIDGSDYHFIEIMEWGDSDKWQIKRAEPVVLSASEIFIQVYDESDPGIWLNDDIRNAINKSIQNGQLKEWLRPEQVELREAIDSLKEAHKLFTRTHPFYKEHGRLFKAFENLKPPYERDND